MTERIEIDFAMAEGAMLRMLGLIERRGFEVASVSMTSGSGQGRLAVDINPRDASRRVEVIAGQLRRLTDVRQVKVNQDRPS